VDTREGLSPPPPPPPLMLEDIGGHCQLKSGASR
jgi:hypothetical protein